MKQGINKKLWDNNLFKGSEKKEETKFSDSTNKK